MQKSNFTYLNNIWPELGKIACSAEFSLNEDPNIAMYKTRQLGEHITKMILEYESINESRYTSQNNKLTLLKSMQIVPKEIIILLEKIRKAGNIAVHELSSSREEAKHMLFNAFKLCEWFTKNYYNRNFIAEDYVLLEEYFSENEEKEIRSFLYSVVSEGNSLFKNFYIIDGWGSVKKELNNYLYVYGFSEGLALVRGRNYKYGFIDNYGNEVISPVYNKASYFINGVATVQDENGKDLFVDKKGNIVDQPNIVKRTELELDLIPFNIKRKWGYKNNNGDIIIEPKFKNANPFNNQIAIVESNSTHLEGIINRNGDWIIPPRIGTISPFNEGIAAICYLSEELQLGDFAFRKKNNSYRLFEPYITNDIKKIYLNDQGEILLNVSHFLEIQNFYEGLAAVKVNDSIRYVKEDNYALRFDSSYGFINKKGKMVIDPIFSLVEPFNKGLSIVSTRSEGTGVINKKGEWIIKPQYSSIASFDYINEEQQ